MQFNQEQQRAVKHLKGPLLVVAGAGTGKTSVLIGRLAYLVLEKKIPLDQVLLLTFTEKAASEMEERADKIMPYGYFESQIYTFHSLAEKILREFGLEIGLPIDFKLLNNVDQWVFVKKNLDQFELDYYRPLGNPNKFINELLKHFSRLKDENISSSEYLDYVKKVAKKINKKSDPEEIVEHKRLEELAKAYQKYNQLMLKEAYLDFGDLIVYCLQLFKARPNLLTLSQKRYPFIMVDEFQDTNWAQYELVKLLAKPNDNLIVVGDDDQAIYKFRGASLANIMQFKEDYPKAKEVILNKNYRSYQEILDKAYLCIKNNNPYRLEVKLGLNKQLKSALESKAEHKVEFNFLAKEEDEIALVAKKIKEINKTEKTNWSDIAILTRANKTAEKFSTYLSRLGIPNQFVSLRGLYRKEIILNCLAYLRTINNFHNSTYLFSLFNLNIFKIEYDQLIEINRFARRYNLSLFTALKRIKEIKDLKEKTVNKVNKLVKLLLNHGELVQEKLSSQIFLNIVKDLKLIENLDYDRDQEQFSYLNQFYRKIKEFENNFPNSKLADLIEMLDLEIEAGDSGSLSLDFIDNDTVKIMTVHAAKGLEFPYVFLVGLTERKFPTDNRKDKINIVDELLKEKIDSSKDRHIEEERRLFYVAMTRAKSYLHLSAHYGLGELREKKLSRFVLESGFSNEKKELKSNKLDLEIIKDLKEEKKVLFSEEKELILPKQFSFSQLAAFETCPLQYKFAFVLKIPAPTDKASLIFGRVMHQTLHDYLKPLKSGGQTSLFGVEEKKEDILSWSNLKKIYNSRFVNEGYASLKERDDYFKQGLESLKLFYNKLKKETLNILFLEKNFSFRLDNDIIKGTIDRIDKLPDSSLSVIDYKTGKSKDNLNFKEKKQLILYQLFLEKSFSAKVSSLSFYYLNDGSTFSFLASDEDKLKLEIEIKSQLKKIKEKKFLAKPSPMCQYCDFKEICPWRQE